MLCLALAAAALFAPTAHAVEFTFGAGLGVGVTPVLAEDSSGRLLGLAPFAAQVGVFLTRSLVLQLHFSHVTAHADTGQGYLYAVHTAGLERRLKRGWFLAGGLGCALFLPLPFAKRPGQNGARGYALMARVGRDIASLGSSRLRLAAEVTPSFYRNRAVVGGAAMLLEWRWR